MKKILLYIQTSSHPIFQNNTKVLVENYKHTIKKHGLNIDIKTVCGWCQDKLDYDEDIITGFEEKYIWEVNFQALEQFVNQDYDIIIKTNTNTVVNLPLLQKFCNDTRFIPNHLYTDVPFIYSTDTFPTNTHNFIWPSGTFIMTSVNNWKKLIQVKDITYDFMMNYDNFNFNKLGFSMEETDKINNGLKWYGIADDFFIGLCAIFTDIPCMATIICSTVSKSRQDYLHNLIEWGAMHDDINENYLVINCKMNFIKNQVEDQAKDTYEEKFRTVYERYLISSVCKIFDLYDPTQEDVDNLFNPLRVLSIPQKQ